MHVAGSKGKGSTCVQTEALLRARGLKTGLFTSPHLIELRERFRINGKPVARSTFLKHFWFVWDRLHDNNDEDGGDARAAAVAAGAARRDNLARGLLAWYCFARASERRASARSQAHSLQLQRSDA